MRFSDRNLHGAGMSLCDGARQVSSTIEHIMEKNSQFLPDSKDALIFIKPNFNSDIIGLLGGSTDLRILVALVESLKGMGYQNIVIGDGPNVGMFNSKIDAISHLTAKLVERLDVSVMDLNRGPSIEVELDEKTKVKVARVCTECDFFINLPKVKTHLEAGLTATLKNLIGCIVGFDKRKFHSSFTFIKAKNLLRLNEIIRTDFHIVDGLIVMEGNGPARGDPKRLGMLLYGTDPVLIDFLCAKLLSFDYNEIPYLRLAKEKGLISSEDLESLNKFSPLTSIERARMGILYHIFSRNFIIQLRYKKWIDFIFSSDMISKLLVRSGLRQEPFIKKGLTIDRIYVDREKCDDCGKCIEYCPLLLSIPSADFNFRNSNCISCLYCFFACPRNAIIWEGDPGFLISQLEKIRKFSKEL